MMIVWIPSGVIRLFFYYGFASVFGLRYVASPSYRRQIKARWSGMPRMRVIPEAGSMIFSFLLLVVVTFALWSGVS
jgi:hypothetical protein